MIDFAKAERDHERWKNLKSRNMTSPLLAAWVTAAIIAFPIDYILAYNGYNLDDIFVHLCEFTAVLLIAAPVYWYFDWRLQRQWRIESEEEKAIEAQERQP